MSKLSELKDTVVAVFTQEPAVVRGVVVAVTGVLAQVLGHTVVDNDTVDAILNGYTAISALVAALFIRPKVTPNDKVALTVEDAHAANANAGVPTTDGPPQLPNDPDGDKTGQDIQPIPADADPFIPDPGAE